MGKSHKEIAKISIHALREEGDPVTSSKNKRTNDISIHALREEGDGAGGDHALPRRYFYPRPP